MWVWIIILVAIAMAVGPVMLMQPSAGTARIAKMRTHASTLGISVRLPSRSSTGEKVNGAIYSIPLDAKLRKFDDLQFWTLRELKHEHDIHFHKLWDWEGGKEANSAMHDCLHSCIDGLPKGITTIELNGAGLGALWDERIGQQTPEDAVAAFKEALEAIQNSLVDAVFPKKAEN